MNGLSDTERRRVIAVLHSAESAAFDAWLERAHACRSNPNDFAKRAEQRASAQLDEIRACIELIEDKA